MVPCDLQSMSTHIFILLINFQPYISLLTLQFWKALTILLSWLSLISKFKNKSLIWFKICIVIENICLCFFTHSKKEIYLGFVSQLTQNIVYKMSLWIKLIFYYNLKQLFKTWTLRSNIGGARKLQPWKKYTIFPSDPWNGWVLCGASFKWSHSGRYQNRQCFVIKMACINK